MYKMLTYIYSDLTLHVSLVYKQPFSFNKSLWEKPLSAIQPVGVGDKLRYLQLRPQEADVPGAFTPRTIHINRTKVDKESCASFFSLILMARSLFSLMCLPLAILKKCLICLDSAVWSFFTTPLPHKRAVFHTPPHYRHINYLSSSSIKNMPGPNVLLGRLGGFRCNVRVQTALNCN